MTSAVVGFAIVAGMLTLVPGIDTALVLRAAVTQGRRPAYATVAGICLGLLAWGMAAAVGVSALLAASRVPYDVLRLAGAAYLIGLGVVFLRKSVVGEQRVVVESADVTDSAFPAFRRGLLTNLLNPKIGAFYMAVLPQFMIAGMPQLLTGLVLAMVHVVESLLWFSLLIWGTHVLARRLERPAVRRWMDRVTGGVLIGFGLKVALSPA